VEVAASVTRDGKPFMATNLSLSNLLTTLKALLQPVRDGLIIEEWHWIRDTQLHENAYSYRCNGPGAMATLRMAALNLHRLAGYESICAGIQAVRHHITALLALVKRQPQPNSC